ncbi:MAG: class I SAM-dependent methyltransferase [Hyphomicrobiaceae bacterium]
MMNGPEYLEIAEVINRTLGELRGLELVDLGAGSGRVTRQLAELGANVIGVEPDPEQVARANAAGAAHYVRASAEQTGLASESFDIALFSLSLHHISDMAGALHESCRITKVGGRIAAIEPLAPDPMYPIMRFIDDESEAYARAQTALDGFVASGALRRQKALHFASKYRVDEPDALLEDFIAIDTRRSLSATDRPAFETAFAAAHRSDVSGGYLPYWSRIDVFSRL